jgi:hypothetical protein
LEREIEGKELGGGVKAMMRAGEEKDKRKTLTCWLWKYQICVEPRYIMRAGRHTGEAEG